jgi:hypothetical protein
MRCQYFYIVTGTQIFYTISMLQNLNKYLPSEGFRKKILVIIGILVVVFSMWKILALAPWKQWGLHNASVTPDNKNKASIVVTSLTESDQDNDGIPDWEERFWGTDPANADSNGNGISDGIEIQTKKDTDGVSIQSETLNETDLLAQKIAKTSFALGQAGTITNDGANELSDKILEDIKNIKKYQVYDLSIIKSSGSATQKNVDAYGSAVAKVMNVTKLGNDISVNITAKALQDGTPDELKRLDPIIDMYTKAVSDMIKIPAPKGFEQIHLDLINGYARMRDDTKAMKEAFSNPVLTVAALSNTEERFDMLLQSINRYIDALKPYTQTQK